MSYEVDVSGNDVTFSRGFDEIFTTTWPNEIAPNQWFRLAIALDPSQGPALPGDPPYYINPPGTLLTVVAEKFGVDGNGNQFTQIEVRDDTTFDVPNAIVVLSFTINVISTPSHQ